MKLNIIALTGLVALVASQDTSSTTSSLTPQQSCATKCTCNFQGDINSQLTISAQLQVTLLIHAATLHAIRSLAPIMPWQTKPPLAQLPVLREMVPPTKPRPMPAVSRLALALCSSPLRLRPLPLVPNSSAMSLLRQPPVILALEVRVYPLSLSPSNSIKNLLIYRYTVADSKTNNAERTGSSQSSDSSATSTGSTTTESGSASQIGVQFGVAGVLGAVMAAFFL